MFKNRNRKALRSIGLIFINILLAMAIGSIFILLQHENPLNVYYYLLIQPLSSIGGIVKVLGRATPLIFTSLAALICFRCELFNVGVEGQIYIGALAGSLVLLFAPIRNHILIMTAAVLSAALVGGLWSLLAGWLKVRFSVHEVISTIMLNYVATSLVTWIIVNFLKRDGDTLSRSEIFNDTFTGLYKLEHLNTGFFIAIAAVVVMFLLVSKMPLGWQIDTAGKSMTAAKYAGINARKLILVSMAVSGALAGLCGLERCAGVYGYIECGFSPGYGYDGMIVAIIGHNNPIGGLICAVFFGLLYTGGTAMNVNTNVETEWVYVLIAIMFILVAAEDKIILSIVNGFKKLGRSGKRGR